MAKTPLPDSSIIERYSELPVSAVISKLSAALQEAHCVLSAPTGSGKTTLVPIALLTLALIPDHKKIIMLEPRRIAARAAAVRMSTMVGAPVGTIIGYRTRFDSNISAETRIEVVTEGILIRKIQDDPELADTQLIIFDEFHERNLQSDLGLALCLDLCELREDLRLLVMSATLEAPPICTLLGGGVHIEASGRSYPVDIHHPPVTHRATNRFTHQNPRPGSKSAIVDLALTGIARAIQEQAGDILVFLPGAGEIHLCRELLAEKYSSLLADTELLPLYGNLSHQEQDRIFQPKAARRRVILSTPIAETSLTIDGIRCVVDTGYYRRPVHDQSSGLSRLTTARISKASADQRAGRAGRTAPGICYRLWDKHIDHGLLTSTPPEIINSELSALVLQLALWGVRDYSDLKWIDPPRRSSWDKALVLLRQLNCLTDTGDITALGRKVTPLPVHPRLGVLLIKGNREGACWTSCLLAALLSDKDIFRSRSVTADILPRLEALWSLADAGSGRKVHPATDVRFCKAVIKQARQLLKIVGGTIESKPQLNDAGSLLAHAYPDRVASLRSGSRTSYLLANGRGAMLAADDSLAGTPLLVAAQVGDTDHSPHSGQSRIYMAAPITRAGLEYFHTHLLQEIEDVSWDQQNRRVKSAIELRLGQLVLESKKYTSHDSDKTAQAFMDGVGQNGLATLPWTRESRDLQARLCSLHHWLPDTWPDLSDEHLANDLDWLVPYCSGMRNLGQLKSLDMKAILLSMFDWNQAQQIDGLAPSHIQVPSGSKIRLNYTPGEAPVLAVRLQELFGLYETPQVCRNSVSVLIHLLSPAQRPIQVTQDLKSFWLNTYPEVRKEMAGRYPKHYWPQDPFEAQATRKTKKQMDRK